MSWPAALQRTSQYYDVNFKRWKKAKKGKGREIVKKKTNRRAEQLNELDPAASHACLCSYKPNLKMIKRAEERRKWRRQQNYLNQTIKKLTKTNKDFFLRVEFS